jgi:hypothetical protein
MYVSVEFFCVNPTYSTYFYICIERRLIYTSVAMAYGITLLSTHSPFYRKYGSKSMSVYRAKIQIFAELIVVTSSSTTRTRYFRGKNLMRFSKMISTVILKKIDRYLLASYMLTNG